MRLPSFLLSVISVVDEFKIVVVCAVDVVVVAVDVVIGVLRGIAVLALLEVVEVVLVEVVTANVVVVVVFVTVTEAASVLSGEVEMVSPLLRGACEPTVSDVRDVTGLII